MPSQSQHHGNGMLSSSHGIAGGCVDHHYTLPGSRLHINIDVEAATRQGVVVVNAPTGNTMAAAEHTIAMMLALARHIPQANAQLKSGVWQRSDSMGIELRRSEE